METKTKNLMATQGVFFNEGDSEAVKFENLVQAMKKDILANTDKRQIQVVRMDGDTMFLPTPQTTGTSKQQEDYAESKARELAKWYSEIPVETREGTLMDHLTGGIEFTDLNETGMVHPITGAQIKDRRSEAAQLAGDEQPESEGHGGSGQKGGTRVQAGIKINANAATFNEALGIEEGRVPEMHDRFNDLIDFARREVILGKGGSRAAIANYISSKLTPEELLYFTTENLVNIAKQLNMSDEKRPVIM